MKGIFGLDYKLLLNNKGKITAVLVGVTFALFLGSAKPSSDELQERAESERMRNEKEARSWTDATTGLTWTFKDNGFDVDWDQAVAWCRNLNFDGHRDWRLPEIGELKGIYDPNRRRRHVKGGLQRSGWWYWSATTRDAGRREAWDFDFISGRQGFLEVGNFAGRRALCVRRSDILN
jgi:hypothetical protein